jgi:hypothetical protein
VHCEVVELGNGVYELTGTPLQIGHYHMCIRLGQRAPSAADPAGRGGSGAPAARVQAANAPDLSDLSESAVVETVEHEAARAIALEEAEGVISVVKVVAGATWPPACALSGEGLVIGYEGEETAYEVQVYDRYGNAAACGGEHFELRAHKLLPGGMRRVTPLQHTIDDQQDGTYIVRYTPPQAGRWELSLLHRPAAGSAAIVEAPSAADKWRAAIAAVSPPKSPQKKASGGGNAALAEAAQEMATVLGGRSFMVVVRPALARHLSDEEARTAMEVHARAETALACEAFGPGLGACVAGEMRSLTVRTVIACPLHPPPCSGATTMTTALCSDDHGARNANGKTRTPLAQRVAKHRQVKPAVDSILRAGNAVQQGAFIQGVLDHPSMFNARKMAAIHSSKESAAAKYVMGQSARMMERNRKTSKSTHKWRRQAMASGGSTGKQDRTNNSASNACAPL